MIELTEELVDRICAGLMDGKSLRALCEEEGMPDRSTLHRWMAADLTFATKCARAREIQADAIFEDMQDVADTGNPEDVQRAKLRVSTMQWRAAKLAPKKYGERTTLEHTDPAGNNPFTGLMEAVAANGRPRPQAGD